MTHEQQIGLETYYRAEERYKDASVERGRAESEIVRIQNRRREIINEINQCNSERRRYERSLQKLKNVTSKNSDIESRRKESVSKLETASTGFAAIGTCTSVTPKRLLDVFEERERNTARLINDSFNRIKNTSSSIGNKIDDFNKKSSRLQNEKEQGLNRERQLREYVREQTRIINHAS